MDSSSSSDGEDVGLPQRFKLPTILPSIDTATSDSSDDNNSEAGDVAIVFSSISWAADQVNTPPVLGPRASPRPSSPGILSPSSHRLPDLADGKHTQLYSPSSTAAASTHTHTQPLAIPSGQEQADDPAVMSNSNSNSNSNTPGHNFSWLAGAAGRLAGLVSPSRTPHASGPADAPLPPVESPVTGLPVDSTALDTLPATLEQLQQLEIELAERFHEIVQAGDTLEARSHLSLEGDVMGIGLSELDALIARLQGGAAWDLAATRPAHLPDPNSLFSDSDSDTEGAATPSALPPAAPVRPTAAVGGSGLPISAANTASHPLPRQLAPPRTQLAAPRAQLAAPRTQLASPPSGEPLRTARPMPPRFKLFTGLTAAQMMPVAGQSAVASSADSAAHSVASSRRTVVVDLRANYTSTSTTFQQQHPQPISATLATSARPAWEPRQEASRKVHMVETAVGFSSSDDDDLSMTQRRQLKTGSGQPTPVKIAAPEPTSPAHTSVQHSVGCGSGDLPAVVPSRSMFVSTCDMGAEGDAADAWTLESLHRQWVAGHARVAQAGGDPDSSAPQANNSSDASSTNSMDSPTQPEARHSWKPSGINNTHGPTQPDPLKMLHGSPTHSPLPPRLTSLGLESNDLQCGWVPMHCNVPAGAPGQQEEGVQMVKAGMLISL